MFDSPEAICGSNVVDQALSTTHLVEINETNKCKNIEADLTQDSDLFDIKLPASRHAFYFMGASRVVLHKKNGKWIGYQPVYRNLVAVDESKKWISGNFVQCPELFERCYRTKTCTKCGKERLATFHDWKLRGAEGPFKEIWGIRDNFCKGCRSKEKAAAYEKKKRMQEQRRKLCESFRPFVVGSLQNSAIQKFSEVLSLATRDLKEGDLDGKNRQKSAKGASPQDRS